MASSSSLSSSFSSMRNWNLVIPKSFKLLNSSSSFEGITDELLIPEDVRGRVVLYDVFISHRGSDAKKDAAQIHEALKGLGVGSFFDTDGIFKGENLSAVIVEAINSSTVFLVLFSKGFAESAWCLEELRLMMEKMKEERNQAVLVPVFVSVEPGDLKDVSRGAFSKAFQMHKKGKEFSSRTIKNWEVTLKEASTLLGPRLSDFNGVKEDLFKAVVEVVVKRVRNVDMEIARYPVAVDEKVQELCSIINHAKSIQESPCVLHIVGMTGIGKTTVAKKYFNLLRSSFGSACFVEGIRVKAKSLGLPSLQKMILKELVLLDADVRKVKEGIKLLKKRLQGVEVLLVLDDVDHITQLDALMVHEVLSPGSVVLVTTTDSGLYKGSKKIWYYEMTKLDRCKSRKLFLMHAMGQQQSTYPELVTLIEEYLNLCDGLPLSLEVVGQLLAGVKSRFYWQNILAKVSDVLPLDLKKKFQSYFENLNQIEKEVLYYIALFFDGAAYVSQILDFWESLGEPNKKVIEELAFKHGFNFAGGVVSIHPQMKQYIIQSLDDDNKKHPRHIKHLWRPKEVQKVLDQNPGIENLDFLSLVDRGSLPVLNGVTLSNVTWMEYEDGVFGPWFTECFAKMSNLKFLILEDKCVYGDLGRLPKSILWLRWRFYPYEILPVELITSNLRVLELDGGTLSSLWSISKLKEIPSQLRHLHLKGCIFLESLPVSIGTLKHLQVIVLNGCTALTSLPDEICNAQSLKCLEMNDCSALKYLPPKIGNLKNLRNLHLARCTELLCLPNSFFELVNLRLLDLSDCKNMMKIPHSFKTLSELTELDLTGCGFLDLQPNASHNTIEAALDLLNSIVQISSLHVLKLSVSGNIHLPGNYWQHSLVKLLQIQGPELVELPWSLGYLSGLTHLALDRCLNLKSLVNSIGNLKELNYLRINNCGLVELPEEIGDLCNLEYLEIVHCNNLTTLPSSLKNLSRLLKFKLVGKSIGTISHESFSNKSLLKELVLGGCNISDECLSMISKFCQSLTYLQLHGLPITHIKITEIALPNLVNLSIVSCNNLFEVEVFPNLQVLHIVACQHLKRVSVPSGISMWLRDLTLNHCPELYEVQSIEMLQNLEKIHTEGCRNLHYIQGLELVQTLKEMHIYITYWGYSYHGDEWLQKLQVYIYAQVMHFVTTAVLNKDKVFENFEKMNQVSSQCFSFQLPESTVSCAWIMVGFLSEITVDFLSEEEGKMYLTLWDGRAPINDIHEYQAAGVGEMLHFSIFSGDFWLCKQLKKERSIKISSSSPFLDLRAGWVRILDMEEESNIEAIQNEFFEKLRKEKEADLRYMQESRKYLISLLLDSIMETSWSSLKATENELAQVANALDLYSGPSDTQSVEEMKEFHALVISKCKMLRRKFLLAFAIQPNSGASQSPLKVKKNKQRQVTETLDLNMCSRSAEDMRDFEALGVANCRILRYHFSGRYVAQLQVLVPNWKKKQVIFLEDRMRSLSHLQLEISKACRSAAASVTAYCSQSTYVQVTVRENYKSSGIIHHKFVHNGIFKKPETFQDSLLRAFIVVVNHGKYVDGLKRKVMGDVIGKELDKHLQFFADEKGPAMFLPIPNIVDDEEEEEEEEEDDDDDDGMMEVVRKYRSKYAPSLISVGPTQHKHTEP